MSEVPEFIKDGNVISGRKLSKIVRAEVAEEVKKLKEQFNEPIKLATVLVGDNPASKLYVGMKQKACAKVGIESVSIELPGDISENELYKKIMELNEDPSINGILVQLPLPRHINEQRIIRAIKPEKDVDGFHPFNVYALYTKDPRGIPPATPAGIIRMLKAVNEPIEGKHAVIINRSIIVGKPLIFLLLNENATVTVCHSRTKNLAEMTRQADILISAIGRRKSKEDPYYITEDMVKEGAIVIDVATPYGDVDFENVKPKAKYITPVPGGVGPMTVSMLLVNVIKAYKMQKGLI
ncbi:MAG: bifunctional 5,10-methylenetetrahydrofolate dehydrogenase/5,10-methenyltetrahydrofolate cyclohydrolase [Candidatus Asgardarchaeia archaeon]